MSTAVAVGVADRDGGPTWAPARGQELLPGLPAWHQLDVGPRRETWLCWSLDWWEPVLVKLVRPEWRPRALRALDREARALTGLQHPLVPRLLVDGRGAPVPHLVIEYLNGPALDEVLDETGPLPAEDLAGLAVGLLGALRYVHGRGFAHLDVCPDNVLEVDHRARLVDLGCARPLGTVLAADDPFGSEGCVAPEARSGGPVTVTTTLDVFSAGATLRFMADPDSDPDGAIGELLALMTDPDPARRPSVESAMAAFVRRAGKRDYRPWPAWADKQLDAPPRRARRRAAS